MKNWFKPAAPHDRRDGQRHVAPRLKAYYWDGDQSVARGLRDISLSGFYLFTEERWYPGTVILIRLQRTDDSVYARSERAISVQSRVVRSGEDGVAFRVVAPDAGASLPDVVDVEAFRNYVWRLFGGEPKPRTQ
jgi:hypothetical protein